MKKINIESRKTINLSSICDLFEISDDWELCAWPISYNESVSFIFRNVTDGDVAYDGSDKDYRFKIFTVSDFDFSNAQKRDISLHGLALVSVFFCEQGYAFAVRDEDDNYLVVFYNEEDKEVSKIKLGPNVTRIMLARDGRIAFGYSGSLPEILPCFVVISRNGDVLYKCEEGSARSCMDLTIDRHENIWASCYPDVSTYEIKKNGAVVKHQYPVACPDGLIPFDLNGKTATILSYSNNEVYVPVNYMYLGDELFEIVFDNLAPEDNDGISAYGGLVIILTKDEKLHFFKLDELDT